MIRRGPLRSAAVVLSLGCMASCSVLSSTDELAVNGADAGAAGADGLGGVGGRGGGGSAGVGGRGGQSGSVGRGSGGAGGPAGIGGSGGPAGSGGASGTVTSGGGTSSAGGGGGSATGGGGGSVMGGGGAAAAGSSGGSEAGGMGAAGGSGSGGAPEPPSGAIVLGGAVSVAGGAVNVLVVLDPTTGSERSREILTVAAVAHDGAVGRDIWYVFESLGFAEPAPKDEVVLRVRTLDRSTGAFTEVSQTAVPALVLGSVAVLTNRVAFLSYGDDAGSTRKLTVIDTTDPAKPFLVPVSPNGEPWAGPDAQGLLGVRPATGVGGTLDVIGVSPAPCSGSPCQVRIQAVTVGAGAPTFFPSKQAAQFSYKVGAQVTWTASATGAKVLLALPGGSGTGKPHIQAFSSAGVTPLGPSAPFQATGRTFRSMAYDECNDVAFLTELNADQAIFAVPLDGSEKTGIQSLGRPAQRVLYEPTTSSLMVPFSQGGEHSLRAFSVDAKARPPKMTERLSSWKPPADVAPGPMAFRAAHPTDCE